MELPSPSRPATEATGTVGGGKSAIAKVIHNMYDTPTSGPSPLRNDWMCTASEIKDDWACIAPEIQGDWKMSAAEFQAMARWK
eukprot:jgi/Tetstr1/453952/TSEL_040871.t1